MQMPILPNIVGSSMFTPNEFKTLVVVESSNGKHALNELGEFTHFSEAIASIVRTGFGSEEWIQNFFTFGCKNFHPWQKRGLERIILRRDPIEIHCTRSTRFFRHREFDDTVQRNSDIRVEDFGVDHSPIDFGIGLFKKGNILIVGDRPGPTAQGKNIPFVGEGCGAWLLKIMERHDIDERKLYWINSKDNFGVPATKDFLALLQPSKIICLGGEAAKWALDISDEYDVVTVPHPQYWRRFKSKERYPLLDLLK